MKIAIVTPTHNRSDFLKKLYLSLLNQNKRESITWIVIDDGSNDNTEMIVKNMKDENLISIEYTYQKNSGKAAALNLAFKTYNFFDFFLVVDSDDHLLENVFNSIETEIRHYENKLNVGAIFFRYMDSNNKILSSNNDHKNKTVIMKRSDHDSKYGKYDGCVGYYKRVISKYSYPVFYGEKYMGPTVIQLLMEDDFEIVFSNKVVGVAEYQDKGLTKSGRLLRIKNPLGMKLYSWLIIEKSDSNIIKLKYAIAYNMYVNFINYFYFDKNKKTEKNIYTISTVPFGFLLYLYYKNKYKDLLK
ncbi:glycosyltransferase family A protein [Enterococcus casseliflavus]|uniref:glycosyltransferase family A protein n=1 Tax=Enterococcus casseliflavus TaxID=37734 RepID=UPI003D0A6512